MDYWKATTEFLDDKNNQHNISIVGCERDSDTEGHDEAKMRMLFIARKNNFTYTNVAFEYIDADTYKKMTDDIDNQKRNRRVS